MTIPFYKKCRDAFENGNRRTYYLTYTLFFCLMALLCFSYLLIAGKSFIWRGDAWIQYFKALVYYSDYLKGIVGNLVGGHGLVIPDWDFNIGEGGDIVGTLHYYAIGDPIALLSVFCPKPFLDAFFAFSIVLRLFLAGAVFSALCFGLGKTNTYAILTGSIAYAFSLWELSSFVAFVEFLNAPILFPLIIYGIEKVLAGKRPYLLVAAVALSAACNFYFFYMYVVLGIIYVIVRLATRFRHNPKAGLVVFAQLAGLAVVGVCVAGVILLPVLMMMVNDPRIAMETPEIGILYPIKYYTQLPAAAISTLRPNSLNIALAAPLWFSVVLLFLKRRNNLHLKILFAVCLALVAFPLGGSLLNGMSYVVHRWTWAFFLLCSYTLVVMWDDLVSLSKRHWRFLAICSLVLFALVLHFDSSRSAPALSAVALFFATLLFLAPFDTQRTRKRQWAVLAIVMATSINLSFWLLAPDAEGGSQLTKTLIKADKVWELWDDNETAEVKEVSGGSFARYTERGLTSYNPKIKPYNVGFVNGISSTAFYFSNASLGMSLFRNEMDIREDYLQGYIGYDERTALNALSAVQYYVTNKDDNGIVPYGYSLVRTTDGSPAVHNGSRVAHDIYQNDYALPFGYCYSAVIEEGAWEGYNPVQKQESQLSAALIEDELDQMPRFDQPLSDYLVPFEIECDSKNVSQVGNSIVATADNASFTMKFNRSTKDAETYFSIEGFKFTEAPGFDLYFGDPKLDPNDLFNDLRWENIEGYTRKQLIKGKLLWSPSYETNLIVKLSTGASKYVGNLAPEAAYSCGRTDYIANFGYTEEEADSITVTLTKRGIYSFDNLFVYEVPMDDYPQRIEKLREEGLYDYSLRTDGIHGTLTVGGDRILCVATPYSKGWSATVDGQEAEVVAVNRRYLGVYLPEGTHEIDFHYRTPFKDAGLVLTFAGLAATALIAFFTERARRKSSADTPKPKRAATK